MNKQKTKKLTLDFNTTTQTTIKEWKRERERSFLAEAPHRSFIPIKIVLAVLLVALPFGGFVLGMQYQQKVTLTTTQNPLAQSSNQPETPLPEGRWKTYTYINKQYGFTFEYPQFMYIEEGNDSIVTLSTSKQFEEDEFALVIDVNTGTFHPDDNIDSNEQIVEKDLRLSEITQNTGLIVAGSFFGNSPWNYYSVYFHRSGPIFVQFKIRIHSKIDTDLTYKTNITNNYKKLVTEILSTLIYLQEENVSIPDTLCIQNGGTWDGQYSECSSISESICENIGGQYFDCASACRHDPKYPDVACIKVCDRYCQL